MKSKRIIVICLLSILTACASTVIPTEELKAPASSEQIVIERELTVPWRTARVKLALGAYSPVFENSQGTFYRGPSECVMITHENGTFQASEGGFWLPDKKYKDAQPRLFVYTGTMRTYEGGTVRSSASIDPASTATTIAIQSTPPGTSPATAGLGAGIATGIVSALATVDTTRITFIFDPIANRAALESTFKAR